MKTKFQILLAALVLAVAASNHAVASGHEHHHEHGHESSQPQKLQLNAGKKWETDAPLRQAMSEINQAMAKAVPLIHKNQFADADYQSLAATVGQKVGDMVANCKLGTKADAMLHLVIADLLAGAETMEGKGQASRHDGAVKVLQALDAYGKYFQHAGWKTARG